MPYPDPPGPRIAYDLDGSIGLLRGGSLSDRTVRDVHPNALKAMNSERNTGLTVDLGLWSSTVNTSDRWVSLIFPTPRRLRGVFGRLHMAYGGFGSNSPYSHPFRVETSPDSTNGSDGTWTVLRSFSAVGSSPGDMDISSVDAITGNPVPRTAPVQPINDVYRRGPDEYGIFPVSGPASRQVRAVRVVQVGTNSSSQNNYVVLWLHLYGEVDTTAYEDRLEMWSTEDDLPTHATWFDWGDTPQASSAEKSFRIKNMSSTRTAQGVTVRAVQAAATTSPEPSQFLTFSVDGGLTWLATADITSLSPGTVSEVIRVRRVTPLEAQLSNWAPRISAETTLWV